MKSLSLLCVFLVPLAAWAEGDAAAGKALAAQLRAKQAAGDTYARARFEGVKGAESSVQVQIKARSGNSAVVYQVLWPKERKGESVLLRRSGGKITGSAFTPPSETRSLQLKEAAFGSALTWEDVIDDPYAWDQQAVVGTETLNRVPCDILESKPSGSSSYSAVRTWVDKRRLIPLQIEKLGAGGKPVRTIQTTRVVSDDDGKPMPATLSVKADGQTTNVEGGKFRRDVKFSEADFSPAGLKETVIPRGSGE